MVQGRPSGSLFRSAQRTCGPEKRTGRTPDIGRLSYSSSCSKTHERVFKQLDESHGASIAHRSQILGAAAALPSWVLWPMS